MRHGTPHAYKYHGCRCEACTAATNEEHRKYQARRLGREIGRRPNGCGQRIFVDTELLVKAQKRDGRPVRRLMQDCGMSRAQWYRVMERGACKLACIDTLCTQLGLDLWEVVA